MKGSSIPEMVTDGAVGHSTTMHWYALSCISNSDRIVADKLTARGIEAWYPHRTVAASRGRRETEQRFFPGYVFARFNLEDGARAIAWIPQVLDILGYGREPVPIPDSEIDSVRQMINSPHVPDAMMGGCPLDAGVGDRVRVLWGPLVGLEGFVVRRKGKVIFRVGIEMMGRAVETEVDAAALQLIGRAAKSEALPKPARSEALPKAA